MICGAHFASTHDMPFKALQQSWVGPQRVKNTEGTVLSRGLGAPLSVEASPAITQPNAAGVVDAKKRILWACNQQDRCQFVHTHLYLQIDLRDKFKGHAMDTKHCPKEPNVGQQLPCSTWITYHCLQGLGGITLRNLCRCATQ